MVRLVPFHNAMLCGANPLPLISSVNGPEPAGTVAGATEVIAGTPAAAGCAAELPLAPHPSTTPMEQAATARQKEKVTVRSQNGIAFLGWKSDRIVGKSRVRAPLPIGPHINVTAAE